MSVDRPGEPAVSERSVVHRRDVPQLTVYSWSREGRMISAWPGDGKAVPPDGCKIGLRIVAFAGGSVREIFLDKEARTHPHPSDEAVIFYQIDGRRVQMVNERSHEVNPGDACLQPTGVQHSTFQLIGGLFVEFALPAPPGPNPEATWITAAAARVVEHAAGRTVKVFDLPGHPLYETRLAEGTEVTVVDDPVGQMFYVVRGRMAATLGDAGAEVETGDSMRSAASRSRTFRALAETVYIQTAIT